MAELPRSVYELVVDRVDATFETLGEDDDASDPRELAGSVIEAISDDLRPWRAELAHAAGPLAAWLRDNDLDDPAAAVDVLAQAAGLAFVDQKRVIAGAVRDDLATRLTAVPRSGDARAFAESLVGAARTALADHATCADGWVWLAGFLEAHLYENTCLAANDPDAASLARDVVALVERAHDLAWSVAATAAVAYEPGARYAVGQRLLHPRFGEGVVTRLIDTKIEVTFGSDKRVLATKR